MPDHSELKPVGTGYGASMLRMAIRHGLPWVAMVVLACALILPIRQLAVVALLMIPVAWRLGREVKNHKDAEQACKGLENRLDATLGVIAEGVLTIDASGTILTINAAAETLLNDDSDALCHQPLRILFAESAPSLDSVTDQVSIEQRLIQGRAVPPEEVQVLRRDGTVLPVNIAGVPLALGQDQMGAVVTIRPLEQMKALENRIRMMATIDSATGVLNRLETERMLNIEIERARRHSRPLSILMIEIDHFGRINETYGQHNGMTVLRAACDAMTGMMRTSDIIGRFAESDFMVILPETTRPNALTLAERLRTSIAAKPVHLNGHRSVYFTISIGVTAFPHDGQEMDALLQSGDLALYNAKCNGRNCVHPDPNQDHFSAL